MVLPNFKNNMELNSNIIIALPNVYAKVSLEPAVDKQTQVDGIWSETHVEFVRHQTSLTTRCNTQYRYIPILF